MKYVSEADTNKGWSEGLGARQKDVVNHLENDAVLTSESIDDDGNVKTIFLNGDEYAKKTDRPFKKFESVIARTKDNDGINECTIKLGKKRHNGLRIDYDDLDDDDNFGSELARVFNVIQKEYDEYVKAKAEEEAKKAEKSEEDEEENEEEDDGE